MVNFFENDGFVNKEFFYHIPEKITKNKITFRNVPFCYKYRKNRFPEEEIIGWNMACRNPDHKIKEEGVYIDNNLIQGEISEIINQTLENRTLGNNILVQAGHYIPNLKNLDFISNSPLNTLNLGFDIIDQIKAYNSNADMLIFLNDLNMGDNEGKVRDEFLKTYSLPTKAKNLILDRKKNSNIIVLGERQMSNKLNREKDNLALEKKDNAYFVNIEGIEYPIIVNNEGIKHAGKGRCLAACTRIIPFAEQLGYTGIIQVYPRCTVDTIENATKASKILYDSKIPVVNVYKTNSCFK